MVTSGGWMAQRGLPALVGGGPKAHVDDMDDHRDPSFIRGVLPVVDAALSYFDPEIRGFDRIPEHRPVLVVGNHSGGIYMPDFWALFRHWVRERGIDDPLYCLGFDFMFSIPGVRSAVSRLGVVPANQANAAELLQRGCSVLVYPGGDKEAYRPWTERHRIDFDGHTGFVRLALREQVPVVPIVAQGSHDSIVVLTRGDAVARRLGLHRLRIKVLPVVAGPPWGIAPVPVPILPLPAKVLIDVCEPLDWGHFGPDASDDPEVVRHCYEEVLGRMQAELDDLVKSCPHPILTRVRDPARHGSMTRHDRP